MIEFDYFMMKMITCALCIVCDIYLYL